jgi:hypothetical protein
MSGPPTARDVTGSESLDGHTEAERLATLESMVEHYTDGWDADSGDSLRPLLRAFVRFESGVSDRIDDAPGKHRLAFLDAMGYTPRPPCPATVPVTVDVDPGAGSPGGVCSRTRPTTGSLSASSSRTVSGRPVPPCPTW